MDTTTQWLLTEVAVPVLTTGVFLTILLFFNGVILHLAGVLLVSRPPELRRSSIVAVQTLAIQVGLAITCIGMLFWSVKHGALYGIVDPSRLQLLFTDCGSNCGLESLNSVSTATGTELLSVVTDWGSALIWYELSIGALLSVSAGLVLSIQLNTSFGHGLWIALIKDTMNLCLFLFIGVVYLALSTLPLA